MKRFWMLLLVAAFGLSLAGCATGKKEKDLEMQGLRNQITALEAQVQSKDEELNALKEAAAREAEEKANIETSKKKVAVGEVKSRPNNRQIQIALRNAGFEPGSLDGKIGKQTIQAIKDFQNANNLPADGKVGNKTWKLLRKYLYQKMK